MNRVAIIIAYFGDRSIWDAFADRAEASAKKQTWPCEIHRIYGQALHEARNLGAQEATADWLVFLDADDELDPLYVEKMLAGTGKVRQPATLGIVDGKEDPFPVVIPAKPFFEGNYIVVSAMVDRQLFLDVGGFRDLPAYEDWDLWIRCWLAGAEFGVCADAILRVHIRSESRNKFHRMQQVNLFNRIVDDYKDLAT